MDENAWLAVEALPGMGAHRIAALASRRLDWPLGWLAALPGPAASALRLWLDHPATSPLQARIDATRRWREGGADRHVLHPGHPAWPALLDELPDPPPVLWALGDLAALQGPSLAVDGTRRPTAEGAGNARGLAAELSRRGWCVVSGMALGVDALAQTAALDEGGATVAVLGCGVDVIYPARHRTLYERLARTPRALILAEHPPGTQAHPAFFPRRNRIVTGLSLGTLVIEATEKSGTLVSARLALEQGRELFAVPGSIHNVQATGCLSLLKSGATLVRHVDDIVAELGHWAPAFLPTAASASSPAVPDAEPGGAEPGLLGALTSIPTPIDLLVQNTGWSVAECQRELLMLELDGAVAQQAGGWVRRR
ncbi:DNA-processing protein DprA [Halomonas sp. 707D7]|uniref:DNA-processing protein DprA n=1 Tax=Halomonas sp. 707D7 TaxID=1681044 RepID=UPI0020A0440F|nr:DNA-processing protein DprA [Halomonas sp. 707D7]MCP1313121.1 DNA-processing protein DprA [Halomonas sp. 707D7]